MIALIGVTMIMQNTPKCLVSSRDLNRDQDLFARDHGIDKFGQVETAMLGTRDVEPMSAVYYLLPLLIPSKNLCMRLIDAN